MSHGVESEGAGVNVGDTDPLGIVDGASHVEKASAAMPDPTSTSPSFCSTNSHPTSDDHSPSLTVRV